MSTFVERFLGLGIRIPPGSGPTVRDASGGRDTLEQHLLLRGRGGAWDEARGVGVGVGVGEMSMWPTT